MIVGLGRLGLAMINTLNSMDFEVLGIDSDEDLIQDLSDEMPNAHLVAANATDEAALRGLNVGQFDAAAVVIGESIEAAILATANLKHLGVPYVIARALSELHARVLGMVGADRVIKPEEEMGEQLARSMASPAILDYVDLGEDEALIEAEAPEQWVEKSLAELQLSRKYGLTVLALKPKKGSGSIPSGDTILHKGDVVIVGGQKKNLDRLEIFQDGNNRR